MRAAFSVPSCAPHRTPLLLPQREPCFHPQQDVVCSKQQMWLLMLQLGWGNFCLRVWQEHRVLTNQTLAFWKALTDKGLAHCVWWEQKIWNALSCSETKFTASDSCPQASSQQVRAQTPQLSPCHGWQEHTGNKEPELSSSSEVSFLFQGGSLGCPELTVQLLCFQSK